MGLTDLTQRQRDHILTSNPSLSRKPNLFLALSRAWYHDFSRSARVGRYERMVQQVRGVTKNYEGTLRFLDERDKELVQLGEGYKKLVIKYSRASN
ncbi:hypothetical protein Bca4012_090772 [Brassica carinata]